MKAIKAVGIILLVCLSVQAIPVGAQRLVQGTAETDAESVYSYYYRGSLIELQPSRQLVAIKPTVTFNGAALQRYSMTPAPISDEDRMKLRGYSLYAISPENALAPADFQARIRSLAQSVGGIIQPVFEQGRSMLIPDDEIIVGFGSGTSFDEARALLEPNFSAHGIVKLRGHRKNTFLVTIDRPSNGRIYSVSRALSRLDKVEFAEPNHLIVMQPRPLLNTLDGLVPSGERVVWEEGPPLGNGSSDITLDPIVTLPVGWTMLVSESFESTSLPAGWSTGGFYGAIQAYWRNTTWKSHSGSRSCYATGGGSAGISPPGPYPNNAATWLDTPLLNLAAYEEVYIELWFYAKYENPFYDAGAGEVTLYDFGVVGIYDPSINTTNFFSLLAVPYTGDLTSDPTTDSGWRRALIRVPPALKDDGVQVEFVFASDSSITREGLYIDQVRVIGTTEVDTTPLGNDTYSARLYELKNAGQIAGLGSDTNDLEVPEAWDHALSQGIEPVSADVAVAVIDSGVDLLHPDLNIAGGYEHDGSAGGDPTDPHGTAVAGNIGAVKDNNIGVIGTAPGVSILAVHFGETEADLAVAIDTAVSEGAHVLNNSWGWVGAPSADIENAIADALDAGRTVLFAAGNGPDRPPWTYDTSFPCNLTDRLDVICVGATSLTDEHKAAASSDGVFSWGSSYIGSGPDVCAPGPWSYTTDIRGSDGYSGSDYAFGFGGTSSATPKVSGIAALMLSIDSELPPAEVKRILRVTADDVDAAGVDDKTGAGRANALQAVSYVLGKPKVVTGSASAASPTSTTFTLEGFVNPSGSSTSCYFEYGASPVFGQITPPVDVGSGTADVGVSAEVTVTNLTALHYFRIVASNATGVAYGRAQTFGFDTDADNLPDEWERFYFGDLAQDGSGDGDGDSLINTAELANGTDPTLLDTDGDDLPDGWELDHGLDPLDDTGENGKDGDFDDDGWTNYEEFVNGTAPEDNLSPLPTPPVAAESLPHADAGISDATRVPNISSFAVRLTDTDGIDITDPTAVFFTVEDGVNSSYVRDLSHPTVRTVKLAADADTSVTHLWVVYDRMGETAPPYDNPFEFETTVSITFRAVDIREDETIATYSFKVESEDAHNDAQANLPDTALVPPDAGSPYDRCLEVAGGDLQGARIMYDSGETVQPEFGPLDEVPALTVSGGNAAGVPLNLQPPMIFNIPAAIRIPCPGYDDVSGLLVYFFDGQSWIPASNPQGDVLPGAQGWMVPGSRQNFSNPSMIEIQVYHFSGAQAGTAAAGGPPAGGGGGGCFLSTCRP